MCFSLDPSAPLVWRWWRCCSVPAAARRRLRALHAAWNRRCATPKRAWPRLARRRRLKHHPSRVQLHCPHHQAAIVDRAAKELPAHLTPLSPCKAATLRPLSRPWVNRRCAAVKAMRRSGSIRRRIADLIWYSTPGLLGWYWPMPLPGPMARGDKLKRRAWLPSQQPRTHPLGLCRAVVAKENA